MVPGTTIKLKFATYPRFSEFLNEIDNNFFHNEDFFLTFDFYKRCKNKTEDDNEIICSQFKDAVSHKIDFFANGLNRDHPVAWELKYFFQIMEENLTNWEEFLSTEGRFRIVFGKR